MAAIQTMGYNAAVKKYRARQPREGAADHSAIPLTTSGPPTKTIESGEPDSDRSREEAE